MNNVELTTKEACKIVGIDADYLNTHISTGRFPCAPTTERGRTRIWNLDDTLALWLFRSREDRDRNAKNAGHFACEIAAKARRHPEAEFISIVETKIGTRHVWVYDDIFDRVEFEDRRFPSTVQSVEHYNIKSIRETIAARLEELDFEQ